MSPPLDVNYDCVCGADGKGVALPSSYYPPRRARDCNIMSRLALRVHLCSGHRCSKRRASQRAIRHAACFHKTVTNPPTGGESMPKPKTRAAEKDAIILLKEDHKKIRVLLGELEDTSTRAVDKREELLQTIERELKIHAKIEEQIFYPALDRKSVV